MRRNITILVAAAVAFLGLTIWMGTVSIAANTVGAFEIDGNTPDDPLVTGIDWDTPPPNSPPNLTTFTDLPSGPNDTSISGKWEEPAAWSCGTGSVPPKDNILSGAISFRTIGTEQFAYFNFTRGATTGSANIDYEFNQSSTPNPACPALPQREVGDIVVAFDQSGNTPAVVRVLTWDGAEFDPLPVGTKGVLWDGAVSANRSFGEAAINVSGILGRQIACGDFASVHMASRASDEENAAMKDRTATSPINFANCPESSLTKDVRNVTAGGTFAGTAAANAEPGDRIEYQLSYTNNGTGDATGVVVTDPVPADTTYVADSCTGGTSCSEAGGTVTWNVGTVDPGQTVTLTFQVDLDATFPNDPPPITNIGTADSDEEEPTDSNQATVNVTAGPISTITKAVRNVDDNGSFAATATAEPGDVIEYRITYDNTGNANATDVTITDPVPTKSSYVPDSCTGGTSCSEAGGTVTWNVGTVAPGDAPVVVTFRVQLDAVFDAGETQVTNTATVDTGQEPPKETDPPTVVTVTAAPISTITKAVRNVDDNGSFAATATAEPGDVIEYRITYDNTGNANATDVTITDPVPTKSSYVPDSCTGGTSCSEAGGTVTWNVGTVAPGDAPVVVTFRVQLDAVFDAGETQVTNTATVDTGQEPPKETDPPTVVTVTAAPISTITKAVRNVDDNGSFAATATAEPGDVIEYRITYDNTGNANATDVTITDPVPTKSSYVPDSCTGGTSCSEAGGTVTWNVGTVAPGDAPVVVTFRVQLDAVFDAGETQVTNTATVDTGQEPPKETDPPTVVTVTAAPISTITKAVRNVDDNGSFAATATAEPGDVIEYRITYDNTGNANATDVTITDPVPTKSSYVPDSCTGGTSCSEAGGTVTWNVGTVAPGDAPVVVTFRVQLDAVFDAGETQVTNTATVDTGQEPPKETDPPTVVTVTANPDLGVEKSADVEIATEGDQITYTLEYSNSGNAPATDVVIVETIPGATEFTSCSDDCTTSGDPIDTVTWDVGTVDPGETDSVTLTVTVLNDVGCTICNTATIDSDDEAGGPKDSNELCIAGTPAPNPAGANASGNAIGARVTDTLLNLNVTLPDPPATSSQSGVGADADSRSLLNVDVPQGTGALLSADVLSTTATSTVTPSPAQATQTSTSEVAGLDLVAGLVRASAVRGVATTNATGTGSGFSSAGSTFSNLVVNGQQLNNVAPNTRINLPKLVFGANSYVALREEIGTTSGPGPGELSDGTYAADLEVNMIRVKITDLLTAVPGKQPTEIVVGHAQAHSDFPQTRLCAERADQSVSGHAYIAQETTDPEILPTIVGVTSIPSSGGDSTTSLESLALPGDGSVVSAAAADARSHGEILPGVSQAGSHAQVANVCVLRQVTGLCTVGATAVRSQASSSAVPGAAASTDLGTELVGLTVGGLSVPITPARNRVINLNGLGYIALNQQFCDGGVPPPTCAGTTHTGLTVRQLVVVITVPQNALGLELGAAAVVAEAHSDATYIP